LVGSEEHENHESHNSGPNQRPTDAQHHGHGTKTNKTKQNKTKQKNKKAMQPQTTSSSWSVKQQYPPMYKEVLSWLCALQGRRLLAHRKDILWWAKVWFLYILAPFGVYHRNFSGVTSEGFTWASLCFIAICFQFNICVCVCVCVWASLSLSVFFVLFLWRLKVSTVLKIIFLVSNWPRYLLWNLSSFM
jgi:hypothetical protein